MDHASFSLLPTELIQSVFTECLPDTPSLRACDAPLLLTHVCQTWRNVERSTPRLWSHIAIPRWTKCPSNVYELSRLWITNASSAPLCLDIALFNEDALASTASRGAGDSEDLAIRLLTLLTPHLPRIGSLWVVLPTAYLPLLSVPEMENIERLFFYGAPLYKELLRIPEGLDSEDPETRLTLGQTKRNLRILSVTDCSVDIDSVLLQTQLTHLELFDLHRSTWLCQETAFRILQKLPNLQKCVLELFKSERVEWNGQRNRIVLNNLQLFFVIWIFPADVTLLLDSIATPNLIRLGIRGTPAVGQRPWNGLHDFLRASQPRLTQLTLGSLEDVDIRLLDCLRCCPLLSQLSINYSLLPTEFFQSLTCKGEAWDPALLPRLEALNLAFCAGLDVDKVAACLTSRSRTVPSGFSRLRKVEIVSCIHITKNDLPVLQQCGIEKLVLKLL